MKLNELRAEANKPVLKSDPIEAINKSEEIADKDAEMLASNKFTGKINYNIEYGVKYVTPIEAKMSAFDSLHDSILAQNQDKIK